MQADQIIFIKGMVCDRCVTSVNNTFIDLGHVPVNIDLGKVTLGSGSHLDKYELAERLTSMGLTLMENPKARIAAEVMALVEEVYEGDFDFPNNFRFTNLVSERLEKDYQVISDAFISMEVKNVEQYILEYRMDRVKFFLQHSTLTLSDIAFKLNFSSVAHLSTQFRQRIGMTPSLFRGMMNLNGQHAVSVN